MADFHEPGNTTNMIWGTISCLLLFFAIMGLTYYFQRVKNRETHVKVEMAPAVELRKLRDYESSTLNHYELINKEQKLVRIPIDRAMELEIQGSWRQPMPPSEETPLVKKNDGGTSHAHP